MSTTKALICAFGVTAVSVALLTILNGVPSTEKIVKEGGSMFVIAFIVMKFVCDDDKKDNNKKV